MKRTMKIIALAVAIGAFAAPALAQSKECNDENKGAWYKTFYDNFKGEAAQQKTAYDAAKTYIASCPADPNDQQRPYMEKWVKKYDDVMGKAAIAKEFDEAIKQKKYADQIRLGKQLLATDPDNSAINIVLGSAGLGDPNVLSESAQYAKKSIELIEAGKPFAPLTSKDQALAYLSYVIAKSAAKSDPNTAITYFVKAAKYESDLKKNPLLYNELAAAYGEGPVAKLTQDYQAFVGKPESTESKLVKANLNQAIDRQIDAFARAAATSTNGADKKAIMDVLTGLYKDRNGNDTGLNDLLARVLSTPVPDVPTPITTLPASSSTPATNGGTNGATTGTPAASSAKKPQKNR
ncbi:MAG TPA: hypothetical protein VLN44_10225 [Pyrinomonadaceae bacterium]|nr:hypothetical protein [Pyrinomonadaceae bacterium]